ncbi:MAG: hypothetical protein MJ233_02740 [Mycoplasmoidaceae bacterium]|nr:hypothetical protein [Mycoplasmoidaceae bacterium]
MDEKDGQQVIHTKDFASSLGADDGAGVALMLAITANKTLSHGPIRCILTADEETGMNGASEIGKMEDGTNINVVDHNQGFDYMLNLDAEKEGDVFVSCAGGYSAKYTLIFTKPGGDIENPSLDPIDPANEELYELCISGGMGGHSGMNMINNPINAVITAAQFLSSPLLSSIGVINLVKIDSHEEVGNVIPGKANFIFTLPKLSDAEEDAKRLELLKTVLSDFMDDIKFYHPKETGVTATIEKYTPQDETFNYKLGGDGVNSNEILYLIRSLMFGAQQTRTLPDGTKELVSSSNVCPVNLVLDPKSGDPHFDFMIFDRSEDEQYLLENYIYYTMEVLEYFRKRCHGVVAPYIEKKSQYPAYVYNPSDKIRVKVFDAYKNLGIQPSEQRTHGGIECA